MPAQSEKQLKYIYAMRNKYGTKEKAPEDMKWVFSDEWGHMKKERTYMKRYKPLFEAYDDATEKKLDAKGYVWSKGKDKSVRIRNLDFWKTDKSGDIDYEFFASKIVKTSHDDIRNVNEFFACFFGDTYHQTYEYGAVSTKESELYELMRKWDMQEGALGKFNKEKQSVKYFIVYPFEDGK